MDKMKKNAFTLGGLIIASAIIWGAVILGCSFALKGTECYGEIQNILVGGTVAHIILLGGGTSVLFLKSTQKAKEETKIE